ncbi:MAG: EthD domain-containing protein [Sphingomonadaceae bacterium]
MIRFMGVNRRREGMALEEFSRYWSTTHADIVLEFADSGALRGYIQNHRLAADSEIHSDWDGSPELFIKDAASFEKMVASDRFKYAVEVDSPAFMQMPPVAFRVEQALLAGSNSRLDLSGKIKLMLFVKNPAGGLADELMGKWNSVARPLFFSSGAPLRIERLTADSAADFGPPAFYGVESSWWNSTDDLLAAWRDKNSLFSQHDIEVLLAAERVMLSPD